MSPLKLHEYYEKGSYLDLVADQILELINLHEPWTTVGRIVQQSLTLEISSPMTTFRKIAILEEHKLISSRMPVEDQRKRVVALTEKGKERLRRWGK